MLKNPGNIADMGDIGVDGLTMNWSLITTSKQPNQSVEDASLMAMYSKVEFSLAILLTIFSPITVFTNGLFLLALYQDSLKCFRKSPSTFFVAGLSLADFITGLLVEPSFAVHYILRYFKFSPDVLRITNLIYTIGGTLSTIAISTSFVIVLAMSLSQYIAIRYPHQYKAIVTSKRVIRLVGISGLYFLAFSMLQFSGISRERFLLLDVILHPTLISILLIIVLILMRKAFKKHVSKPARKRTSQIISRPTTSIQNGGRNDLETTSPLTVHPTSQPKFSPNSSRIQVSSTQIKPLLSHSLGQDELGCKLPLHHNNNTAKKSMEIKLTPIERADSFGARTSNSRNGGGPCTAVHHIEQIKEIKNRELRPGHGKECVIDTGDNVNESHEFHQDMVENDREKGQHNSVTQQFLALSLKRLRDSFYRKPSRKKPQVERQFTILSFYLSAILLLSSLTHTIVFYVFLLRTPASVLEDVYVNIALRITDLMLFLKVLLDAFIYAWRLPAYRRSLVKTISCGRIQLVEDV